ncbi:hypothetical protein ACI2LC_18740 [Nonomuraea wenchangensis]|uniref:Spore-associated protein A n=1 Tax=Nonomuraea wenchangensis TaxID=568860 RepID=A0A1I0LT24_9ACTN|nr:hypothetical protein [Nonomuraea wenchangensis]SEU44843.1 hypothetical protein SAMN05421811_123165 [Nonomuraea wenchangensis]
MKFAKIGIAAAALLGASIAPLALAAAPAQAASCSGSQINSIAVKNSSGTTYGTLKLYYNSSTGNNCAQLDRVVNYGTKKGMILSLYACGNGWSVSKCHQDFYDIGQDSGQFGQYAGPVTVYGKGRCIQVEASVQAGNNSWANYHSPVFHCG